MGVNFGSTGSTVDRLCLYLSTCVKSWLLLYLSFCLLSSLSLLTVHIAVVGLFLCILSYLRCPPPDPSDTFRVLGCDPRNLDGSPSRSRGVLGLIAHRGCGLDAPENSMEAVQKVALRGGRCVHLNVCFTLDNQAVVISPGSLAPLCGSEGDAASLTLAELQKLDLASTHVLKDQYSPPVAAVTAECFADFLDTEAKNMKVIWEFDLHERCSVEEVVNFIVDGLFKAHPGMYSRAMVVSRWPQLIYGLRQREAKIVCGLSWRPGQVADMNPRSKSTMRHHMAIVTDWLLEWAVHEFLWYFLGLAAVCVDKQVLTSAYVQKWRARGIRVIAQTVNNSAERIYIEKCLRVTCMSDTLDEIALQKLLHED